MNNSEVRAHLRKGELAVALLETLGYRFETDPANANRTIWIAPPATDEDTVTSALKKLIKDETAKAYLAGERSGLAKAAPEQGPNWHLVKDMVGRFFRIRPENIPEHHPLREFGAIHYNGVNFKAMSIQYERSATYTGYTVAFEFKTRPFTPQVVRLPLSCAAFR
ncbi:hypothetical protein Mudajogi_00025 [Pseudomonas phage vB_PpuP-Mudajogi]|uniref:Uncharacterized protein n=1 Tax=Pseudomonas phage vB_PpuP-Mudajogi TaxID=3132683 RepID=A0AAX4NDH9_9CAUD